MSCSESMTAAKTQRRLRGRFRVEWHPSRRSAVSRCRPMSKLEDQWLQITREGGYNPMTGEDKPLTELHVLTVGVGRQTLGKTVARGSFAACAAVARLYDV